MHRPRPPVELVNEELQTSLRPGVAIHPGVRSPGFQTPAPAPVRDVRDLDVEPSMASESMVTPPGEATETFCESISEGQRLVSISQGQVLPYQPGIGPN